MNFYEWCSTYSDVISVISAILASFTSILAIIVAIFVARYPYRKGIMINPYFDMDKNGDCILSIIIYNSGRVPIHIDEITVKNSKSKYLARVEDNLILPRFLAPFRQKNVKINLGMHDENNDIKYVKIVLKSGKKKFRFKTSFAFG